MNEERLYRGYAHRTVIIPFIDECRFALDQLFQTLKYRLKTSAEIKDKLAQIETTEKLVSSDFVNQDQWSPNANYYYVQYLERMNQLAEQKKGVVAEAERLKQIRELLARIGATEESMAILAGAILQIAKQVLSFRYASKPQLQNIRLVGSQSVVEVIWEGRNHALHWEDSNPKQPVKDMLQNLQHDKGVNIVLNSNNALSLLAVLTWFDTDAVIQDLKVLVKAT